ncbi:MAG: sugar phosphate isomerase/epimerase family protein, partial [Candidatus Aenigmatarchaeota archaeon]
ATLNQRVREEVLRQHEEADHENLEMTLDVAHANTTQEGPVKFAEELGDCIRHLHVSDNTGEDAHVMIGEGDIDFGKVFRELRPFEGAAIIEGWIPKGEDPHVKMGKKKLEEIRDSL